MTWQLSKDWVVKRDPYNWVLQERKGNRWRSVGYYPTPDQLLRGLYKKLCLTKPANSDLLEHVKHCSTMVEACTTRLSEYTNRELKLQTSSAAQPSLTTRETNQSVPGNLSLDLPEPVTK